MNQPKHKRGLAGLTFLVLISIFRDQLRGQLQSYFGKLWTDPHSSSHGALSFFSLLFSCCFSHPISVLLVTHILWGKGQTTCISIDNRFQAFFLILHGPVCVLPLWVLSGSCGSSFVPHCFLYSSVRLCIHVRSCKPLMSI